MANKSFNAKHGVSVGTIVTDIISSNGDINTPGTITSSIATGTAPLAVSSTTRVANLNVATAGNADTVTNGVYTSRTISTTAPVSGGGNLSADRTISLAAAYGDTQNPYGSKTANWILAAPNGVAGAPVFRAMVASDVPTLNQSTTGNAATATSLQVPRAINGTSFSGGADITTSSWGTSRTITIGASGKSVDGSGNVSWTVGEIGAISSSTNVASIAGLTTTLNHVIIGNGAGAWTTKAGPTGIIVGSDDTQTLTNKTISFASNTLSGVQPYDVNTAKTNVANTWTATQTMGAALRETKITMAANDINLSLGTVYTKTISGATSLTLSNIPSTGTVACFVLELTNGGSAAVTWWSGIKWTNGSPVVMTAAGTDIIGFYTHNAGSTWHGMLLSKDSK
jgi:hypothetical protein